MKKEQLLLLILLFIFVGIQQVNGQPQVTNYSNLNDVFSLYFQDGSGSIDTMWAGTSGGVMYRISDDYSNNYKTLTLQNDGLGSNYITAIAVDDSGNKFFGSFDNGVTMYYETNTPVIFNSDNSPIDNRIYCLTKDNSGHIWAGTANGAFRFNGTDWDSFNTDSEAPGEIRSMAVDGDTIWFASFGRGLYLYDINNATWAQETTDVSALETNNNIPSNNVTAIEARNDSVLVGSPAGISFYRPGNDWITESLAAGTEIQEIEISNSSGMLASTSNGVYQSFGSTWSPLFFPDGLPNLPSGPIETEYTFLWIGYKNIGGGVFRLNPIITSGHPPAFILEDPMYPAKNAINNIISYKDTTIFSTSGAGLLIFDGSEWTQQMFDGTQNIFYDLDIHDDTLFIAGGEASYSVIAYSLTDGGYTSHSISVTDFPVHAIAVDARDQQRIWTGNDNGVYSIYGGGADDTHDFTTADGLLNNSIIAIEADSAGNVWFLHPNGVTMYDETNTGNEFTTYDLSALGFNTAVLTNIAADENGGVWITSDRGVVELNGGTLTHYTTADGLADDHVLSVNIGRNNIKYFGTNQGGISILSDYGWKNITKANGILTNHITAIAYQENRSSTWSGGDWGGISATRISSVATEVSVQPGVVCYGSPVYLDAQAFGGFGSDSYNYTWSSSDGTFTSATQTATVYPETATTYHIEVNDGYTYTDNYYTVMVNTVDSSEINGPDSICPNGEIVSYNIINGTGSVNSYYWTIDGGTISSSDLSASVVDVYWDTNLTTGNLYLTETDTNDCSITQQFGVDILSGIVPNIVLKNGGQILICTDSGYIYQWYKDEVPIPDATRQFYYLDEDLGASVNGAYYVKMDVGNECLLQSRAELIDRLALNAYPVPATSVLNIDFTNENNATGKAIIRNQHGAIIQEILFTNEPHSNHLEVDVSNYKPGTYLYSIVIGSEKTKSGKFIVN